MNKTLKKHGVNISPGTVIYGKWHNNAYTIIRKIGEGAVGTVYLCESAGDRGALKISEQSHSMTVEVNVLKSLEKVQGNRLGPSLLDVDDWETPQGRSYSFYVMEYLEGKNIAQFIKRNGIEWLGVFLFQLLDQLSQLHKQGWVFGDLKIDNLIVVHSPPKVRFIDVGGTTRIGRSIKEYTEFYDRGSWGLGTRKAEPSYDLFALAMVFLHLFYPHEFPKKNDEGKTLLKRLNNIQALAPYRLPLQKAILGRYHTCTEMKRELTNVLYKRKKSQQSQPSQISSSRAIEKKTFFIEIVVILVTTTCYYLLSFLF